MTRSSPFYLFTDFILNFISLTNSPEDDGIQPGSNLYRYSAPKTDVIRTCLNSSNVENSFVAWCGLSQYFQNIWEDLWNINLLFYQNHCCFPLNLIGFSDDIQGRFECETFWLEKVGYWVLVFIIVSILWIMVHEYFDWFFFVLTSVIIRLFHLAIDYIVRSVDTFIDFLLNMFFSHVYRGDPSNDQPTSSSSGLDSSSASEPRRLIADAPFEEESTAENVPDNVTSEDQRSSSQRVDNTPAQPQVSDPGRSNEPVPPESVLAGGSSTSLPMTDKPLPPLPESAPVDSIQSASSENAPFENSSDLPLPADNETYPSPVTESVNSNTRFESSNEYSQADRLPVSEPVNPNVPSSGSSAPLRNVDMSSPSMLETESVATGEPASSSANLPTESSIVSSPTVDKPPSSISDIPAVPTSSENITSEVENRPLTSESISSNVPSEHSSGASPTLNEPPSSPSIHEPAGLGEPMSSATESSQIPPMVNEPLSTTHASEPAIASLPSDSSGTSLPTVDKPSSPLPASELISEIRPTSSEYLPSEHSGGSPSTVDKPLPLPHVSDSLSSADQTPSEHVPSHHPSGSSPAEEESLPQLPASHPASSSVSSKVSSGSSSEEDKSVSPHSELQLPNPNVPISPEHMRTESPSGSSPTVSNLPSSHGVSETVSTDDSSSPKMTSFWSPNVPSPTVNRPISPVVLYEPYSPNDPIFPQYSSSESSSVSPQGAENIFVAFPILGSPSSPARSSPEHELTEVPSAPLSTVDKPISEQLLSQRTGQAEPTSSGNISYDDTNVAPPTTGNFLPLLPISESSMLDEPLSPLQDSNTLSQTLGNYLPLLPLSDHLSPLEPTSLKSVSSESSSTANKSSPPLPELKADASIKPTSPEYVPSGSPVNSSPTVDRPSPLLTVSESVAPGGSTESSSGSSPPADKPASTLLISEPFSPLELTTSENVPSPIEEESELASQNVPSESSSTSFPSTGKPLSLPPMSKPASSVELTSSEHVSSESPSVSSSAEEKPLSQLPVSEPISSSAFSKTSSGSSPTVNKPLSPSTVSHPPSPNEPSSHGSVLSKGLGTSSVIADKPSSPLPVIPDESSSSSMIVSPENTSGSSPMIDKPLSLFAASNLVGSSQNTSSTYSRLSVRGLGLVFTSGSIDHLLPDFPLSTYALSPLQVRVVASYFAEAVNRELIRRSQRAETASLNESSSSGNQAEQIVSNVEVNLEDVEQSGEAASSETTQETGINVPKETSTGTPRKGGKRSKKKKPKNRRLYF